MSVLALVITVPVILYFCLNAYATVFVLGVCDSLTFEYANIVEVMERIRIRRGSDYRLRLFPCNERVVSGILMSLAKQGLVDEKCEKKSFDLNSVLVGRVQRFFGPDHQISKELSSGKEVNIEITFWRQKSRGRRVPKVTFAGVLFAVPTTA
jgi:hypothetical protein